MGGVRGTKTLGVALAVFVADCHRRGGCVCHGPVADQEMRKTGLARLGILGCFHPPGLAVPSLHRPSCYRVWKHPYYGSNDVIAEPGLAIIQSSQTDSLDSEDAKCIQALLEAVDSFVPEPVRPLDQLDLTIQFSDALLQNPQILPQSAQQTTESVRQTVLGISS